ncbi:MAG: hypothetical protein J7498_06445 [Sphingobium sp.]|nr:hypothetical protein [Sphingobium sp.]
MPDAPLEARIAEALADPRPSIPHEEVIAALKAHHAKAIDMENLGRRIAARRAELDITDADIPRNAGNRRTERKKALLKAIRDAGGAGSGREIRCPTRPVPSYLACLPALPEDKPHAAQSAPAPIRIPA